MRAIWKGAVSFGLVTVPVRLYSATESHDLKFRQVRASDGSRIKYKRVAEADGKEVAYADIAKGYEGGDGRMVVLTDDDLAALPNRSSKEISVEKFVPADQIDPLLFDKSYYLEPDPAAVKPYALLREALRESDRMAVVTISVRTRMTMAVLRVRDDVMVCQTMLWPDEVRAAEFGVLDDVPEPKDSERAMATMLIESMAGDFEPNEYEDDYRSAVEELVEAKLEGGDVVVREEEKEDGGRVVDLLAALQKSVERAKAARDGAGSDARTAGDGDGTGGTEGGEDTTDTDDADSEESDGSADSDDASAPKKTASRRAGTKTTAAKKATAAKAKTGATTSSGDTATDDDAATDESDSGGSGAGAKGRAPKRPARRSA